MPGLQEMAFDAVEIPPHILVVEDEVSVATGLKMILDEEGFNVDLAGDGGSALESFRDDGIDLVVADLKLPDISGMEVLRSIKAERPSTEAIIITGYPSVETVVESKKIGVRDYLRKPFSEDEFLSAVNSALRDRGREETKARLNTVEGRLIQRREVMRVLNRTAEDKNFWVDLLNKGSQALKNYRISSEAKAAIISGDLKWLNENIGEFTQKQLAFIYKRLEQEVW
jgi:YesN/AraC family two-component response regulator